MVLKPPVKNGICMIITISTGDRRISERSAEGREPPKYSSNKHYASKGTQREKSPWTASTPTNAASRDDFDRADASHSSHFQLMPGSKLLTLVFQSYLLRFGVLGMLFGVQIPTHKVFGSLWGMVIPPLIQNPYKEPNKKT